MLKEKQKSAKSKIPVIDGLNLVNMTQKEFDLSDPNITELAHKIRESLHNHGFMYLSNHGIPQDLVTKTFEECRLFFTLPDHVKLKYAKDNGKDGVYKFDGYISSGRDAKDLEDGTIREWKEYFDFFTGCPTLEKDAPGFAPTIRLIREACVQLQTKLLQLLAFAIGLEDTDFFLNCCKNMLNHTNHPGFSALRTIYYAPIPENLKTKNNWIGRHPHTDWGLMTLLFQDNVGGLEVKNAQGQWIKATPIPNTIVCNTGGLFELWTQGYFPATVHKVVINTADDIKEETKTEIARQSFAFFLQPDDTTLVEPLRTSVLAQEHDPKFQFQPVVAKEYFLRRASSTMADIVYKTDN